MARTKERKQEMQAATRDYTLNMHKRLQGIAFKKRATRSVRDIKRFAAKEMHTPVSIFCDLTSAGRESGHSAEQAHVVERHQKRAPQGESQNQQKEERGRGCQALFLLHRAAPGGRLLRRSADREAMINQALVVFSKSC